MKMKNEMKWKMNLIILFLFFVMLLIPPTITAMCTAPTVVLMEEPNIGCECGGAKSFKIWLVIFDSKGQKILDQDICDGKNVADKIKCSYASHQSTLERKDAFSAGFICQAFPKVNYGGDWVEAPLFYRLSENEEKGTVGTCKKNPQITDKNTQQGYISECMTESQCEEQEGGKYEAADDCGKGKGCCKFEKCTSFDGYGWVDEKYKDVDCKPNTIKTDMTDKQEGKVCCEIVKRGEEQKTPPPPGLLKRLDLCRFLRFSGVSQRTVTSAEEAKKLLDKGVELTAVEWKNNIPIKWTYNVSITPTECLFNYLAVVWGAVWASVLTFQRGDAKYGTCKPEKPLMGLDEDDQEDACVSCMADPYRVCTKERCEILGNCIAVPTEKADRYKCIAGKCESLGLVGITEGKIEWYIDGTLNGSVDAEIYDKNIRTDLGEIPFNTKSIVINLTTDKPAQCRYIVDKKNASFSEMTDFEDNYFPTLPDGKGTPGWQHANVLVPGDLSRNATHKIFIKCKNACGVEPNASYDQNIISFTLAKKPDQLPPEIVYVDPASNSMIRGDLSFVNASFWLDEKGSCKFSDKSNNFSIDYNKTPEQGGMIPFGPWNNENSSTINGGCYLGKCLDRNESCSRCWLLLNLSRGYDIINYSSPEFNETKMYHLFVRCADVAGNIMLEDSILDYVLMTAPPYNISIIKPENGNKTYDRKPDIEVTSEPRMTECRYRIFQVGNVPREEAQMMGGIINCQKLNWSVMWPIDVGMATLHKGKHNETLNGSAQGLAHTICVKCRDMWQIEETARSDFYVLVDSVEPIIVRMYHDTTAGDYLIIETNEESECVYGTTDTIKCNYNFSDGSAMTTSNQFLHAAYWQLNNLYYVKCKDKWDNYPGGSSSANQCTAIINPYEIPSSL